ncbi:AraC family transcriptional regulator [Paenibacillus daejeonensis]|uniref:AraC family transcriptional regulator n=1 Tax=Paenibacillus daejeonensis TaxID=135193 RepID=UPI0003622A09|nr:AraC family transcriptional regulator [Paenibacillus daejeonensis]
MNQVNQGQKNKAAMRWWGWTGVDYTEWSGKRVHSETGQSNRAAYVLISVAAGCGRLQYGEQDLPLTKGSCFIMNTKQSYRLSVGTEGLSFHRLFFIPLIPADTISTDLEELPPFPVAGALVCHRFARCSELLTELVRLRESSDWHEQLKGQMVFSELIMLLLEDQGQLNASGSRQAFQDSLDYVNRHYDQPVTVDELASMAGISRTHYTRLFKEATGQLPLVYLNNLRIGQAKELLSSSKDSMHAIAAHVGFSNEYYFGRRFKQTVGVSPGQYRRNHREIPRIFSPFLEDYLVALGLKPVAQMSHSKWGKQDYLGLLGVSEYKVDAAVSEQLRDLTPHFIVLDEGAERWGLDACTLLAPTLRMPFYGEDWRAALHMMADQFGKSDVAERVIQQYQAKADSARDHLRVRTAGQTVALLRISAQRVCLYGGPSQGYAGPVLYDDLALKPAMLVERLASTQRRVDLTNEQLAELDADHLFITFDKEEGEGRELLETELWRSLPAVQRGQVYEVDFLSWMNYGVLSHSRKISDVLHALG